MPTKNVNLSERQDRFVRQTVKGGHYRNASEVVRAGLRLLEQQAAEDRLKLARLKRLAVDAFDAIDRGEHVTVAEGELGSFLDSLGASSRPEARAGTQVKYTLRFSPQAVRDIEDVLAFTLEHFGEKQRAKYQSVIRVALEQLASDPQNSRSKRRAEIHPEAWTMHLGARGKRARHLILYRIKEGRFVDIGRLLHDSMEVERHLPTDFRAEE